MGLSRQGDRLPRLPGVVPVHEGGKLFGVKKQWASGIEVGAG